MARMAPRRSQATALFIALIIIGGFFLYAGPMIALAIGVLTAIGGLAFIGDRGRSTPVGLGLLLFGIALAAVAYLMR